MTDRVVNYYQTPVPPGFAKHMIEETGLNEKQRKMVQAWRNFTGDTDFYAEASGLPLKRYNAIAAKVHIRMVDELLRLAVIGWKTENKQ